ncbi:MAG: M42 family peptidase [Desulfatitalea sp.]|nr:M42 family peptidase [Desulfatitalea sp.]
MDFTLLQQLVDTPGVSGREERVRALVSDRMAALGAQTAVDAMGSLIGHIPGKGPKVALIAHMDEIGFLVSKIEPQGFIRVMPVGGIDPRIFGAQKVMVHGRSELPGMVGSIPPHLLKKGSGAENKEALPIEESFIDLGLPAEEVATLVRVGDPVTFATPSWHNDHTFFAKALDDRVGLWVMLGAARQAKRIDADLFLIASTQEEYGLRGAGPAIFAVRPQVALALEGTVASDTPGLKLPPNTMATAQGKGAEIRLTDRGMIADRLLADFLMGLADRAQIPYQVIVKNTGATDATAGQVTGPGVKVGTLSVPTRYIHAPVGMIRKSDAIHTLDGPAG